MKSAPEVCFFFFFCMCDVFWSAYERDRERKRREEGGIFKERPEDGAERRRGSANTFRGGTQGVCVWATVGFFFFFPLSPLRWDFLPVTVAYRAGRSETLSCTHRHTPAYTCTTSAFTARLLCDGKGRESFWDKGGSAFKVGMLSLSVSAKTDTSVYTLLSQWIPCFRPLERCTRCCCSCCDSQRFNT